MTGKELMIGLVVAGLVGAAAGAATGIAVAPKEKPPEQTSDVADRLKSAEDALARTKTELAESRKAMAELQERVTKTEIAAAKAASAPAPTFAGGPRIVRAGRHGGVVQTTPDGKDGDSALGAIDVQTLGEAVGPEINVALDGLKDQLGSLHADLGSFGAGMELRKLPEAERWQKAKDDLNLTWNQVEDLKKAVADREAAIKDAANVEKKNGPNGGTITISRPDPAKLAHAQADYHDRVNQTLNDEQKKSWQSKGYDHAFGSGGFGGAMVMTVSSTIDKSGDAGKDGNK
jgi:gas vesicle protein